MKIFNIGKTPKTIKAASEKDSALKIVAMEDGEVPELLIMDDIGRDFWGDGIPASEVVNFMARNKGSDVHVRVNSYGGDAYEGLVMHNAFAQHDANVTATVEGIAYSAATIAIGGCSKIQMYNRSDFGIHRAWSFAIGNINAMKAAQEWLESVDEHQIGIFMDKTGEDREKIIEWLEGTDDGTIFNANDALAAGFCDEIITPKKDDSSDASKKNKKKASKRIAAAMRHKRALAGQK